MVDTILLGLAGLMALAGVASLAGNLRKHPPSRRLSLRNRSFPEGFLWATGEDAYQHEGGNHNNDWARWEAQTPSPIQDGRTCGTSIDFYHRYEGDFRRAEGDFQNAHRIGVEWSRLEPEKGSYDENAFEHYEDMLSSMKSLGFTVFLNLWHFTLPLWAADRGGWDDESVMERWKALVEKVARRFGKYVDYWSTQIDSQIYALRGNALGEIPPNKTDLKLAMRIYRQLILAHAEAYHIIKAHANVDMEGNRRDPRVGLIYFFFHFEPKSIFIDRYVTRQLENLFNWAFLDACSTGQIDIGIPPGPSVSEFNQKVKGTLDWIGINYYTRQIISFHPFKPGFTSLQNYPDYPKSDMDWEIYPEGLYRLGKKLAERYPGIPLMITESGLADAEDSRRPQFILDHLAFVHRLIEEGCPIFGFTYWSLTDNWEWQEGFRPKFGLYEVDLETKERRPRRKSVELYRFIVRNNRLPSEEELSGLQSQS